MALLNAHSTVKKFIKLGFTEDQAEAVVEAVNEQNKELATKSDFAILKSEIQSIKSELKSEIQLVELKLESKIDGVESRLESKIDKLESKLDSGFNSINTNLKWISFIGMAVLTPILVRLIKDLFFN
jgi:hypothetical protein